MSPSVASTPASLPPRSINVPQPSSTSIGAQDTSSLPPQVLKRLHGPTPCEILKNGAFSPSQNIEHKENAVVDKDGCEALGRYQSELNRLLIATRLLSVTHAVVLVGGYIFTQTDWAGFIDPILDSILPQPSGGDTSHLNTLVPPGALQRFAFMVSPLMGIYTSVEAANLVNKRKQFLQSCEKGGELECLAKTKRRFRFESIAGPIRASACCFLASLLGPTDFSNHRVIIRRTLLLLISLNIFWSLWDILRLPSPTTSLAEPLNRPEQQATTANETESTSEPSYKGLDKRATV